jgi:hypothetical protein
MDVIDNDDGPVPANAPNITANAPYITALRRSTNAATQLLHSLWCNGKADDRKAIDFEEWEVVSQNLLNAAMIGGCCVDLMNPSWRTACDCMEQLGACIPANERESVCAYLGEFTKKTSTQQHAFIVKWIKYSSALKYGG